MIGSGTRGPITEQIQSLYFACVNRDNSNYASWTDGGICK
jgi:branched-chain amino acid aminotransferase